MADNSGLTAVQGARARPVSIVRDGAAWARDRHVALLQLIELLSKVDFSLVACLVFVQVLVGVLPLFFAVGIGNALRSLERGGTGTSPWLTVGCIAFVVAQVMAPLRLVLSQAVARRVDAYCSARLMRFALDRTSLRVLESADVGDELADANEALEHMTLTPGTAAEGALALIARYTQLLGAVVLVGVTVGLLGAFAAAVVALVCRQGQSAAFRRWGGLVRSFASIRRRLSYLRTLATSTKAAKEIRVLGLADWIDKRYTEESRNYIKPLWSARRKVYGKPFIWYAVIGLVATVGALLLLCAHPAGGASQVGRVVIGLQAIVICASFGTIFPEADVKLVYGRSAWKSLLEFERLAGGDSPVLSRMPSAPPPRKTVALEDVTFSYEPGRPVLDRMSLTIDVGRSTAIVGVNGAGKTTLVKILTGLYEPSSGRVTRDGVDIIGEETESWQRHFAVTLQDYVRYELTVRDNVCMGAVGHRDDDAGVWAELDRVGLRTLIESMPVGLDTPLTRLMPGGRDISGGQWQRVALARALFAVRHGASVLILDEPTAQLDARGEAEFYDDFVRLTKGVTSIIISHRFSSVRRADRIMVLSGGKVSESGTHDELVAAGRTYATMFATQASRYGHSGGAA